jgi:small-conductance mechanosensitive channel
MYGEGLRGLCKHFLAPIAVLMALASNSAAQEELSPSSPPQVREFLRLLEDPSVKGWLRAHTAQASAMSHGSSEPAVQVAPSHYIAGRIAAVRQHLIDLHAAIPTVPLQFDQAGKILRAEIASAGQGRIAILLSLFFGLGLAAEWLVRRLMVGLSQWAAALAIVTPGQRLRAAALRLSEELVLALAFAAGSIGLFLVGTWPNLLREIVIGYLFVFVLIKVCRSLGLFLMAPHDRRLRLVTVQTETARYWSVRLPIMVGWLAFAWVTVGLLATLEFSAPARQLMAYGMGLVLVVLGLDSVWRRPEIEDSRRLLGTRSSLDQRRQRLLLSVLFSVYLVALWLLWAAGMMPAFWSAAIALLLPSSLRLLSPATSPLLASAERTAASSDTVTVHQILLERGVRAALIIVAVLVLARAWQIDLTTLAASDTFALRLVRGAVSAIIIVVVADVVWRIVRALIDRRIGSAGNAPPVGSSEGLRRSRLQTLLPILRNVLFVVMLTMAGLMVLSIMGFEIGPLIAGAGIAGVAIGFGAQTLVKDIISGVFYLLDDAFRVGEYIQSGSYKGTVESFSLRSVKLRHHRGPLYTVPFGELGAVENMSRDWVIDKITIGVTYDTDLEQARKLVKQIGKDLASDPELKEQIIEPLKMQGVEQFGDYAIRLRLKMTCRPGEQFVIRRKAYAMVKKVFDANGIKFAQPTVQVAGNEAGAAAQRSLELAKSAAVQPVEAAG